MNSFYNNFLAKSKNNWIITAILSAPVFLLVYFAYKEPRVEIDKKAFKLKGLYGVNLLFSEIAEVDTIIWREMPSISVRANGISFNKVHRGKFITTSDDKIHLNVHRRVNPIVRIYKQDGSVYYINRKNADETRRIFNQLKQNRNGKSKNQQSI